MQQKLIVRLKGGLGNQLFGYAAARAIAIKNNFDLVIDDVTGFVRDKKYRRKYALENFDIAGRRATSAERLEPFERLRRGVAKWLAQRTPYEDRFYIEQETREFDPRLMALTSDRDRYLDGYWQDERYFLEFEHHINEDLKLSLESKSELDHLRKLIMVSESVAVHIRWFDAPGSIISGANLDAGYYISAIKQLESKVRSPHYLLFSDQTEPANKFFRQITNSQITVVDSKKFEQSDIIDFNLMQRCRHCVTANSTFSWWAAWLGARNTGLVLVPDRGIPMRGSIAIPA